MRELRRFRDAVVPAQVLELFHGWKIYDYLIYTRYRFLQRETRWKGLEDSLDECIDESVRTLDQMCFSSQYYMMMTYAPASSYFLNTTRDHQTRSWVVRTASMRREPSRSESAQISTGDHPRARLMEPTRVDGVKTAHDTVYNTGCK